jgi:hypothetical protein
MSTMIASLFFLAIISIGKIFCVLYKVKKRLMWKLRPSVRPSVRPAVSLSVRDAKSASNHVVRCNAVWYISLQKLSSNCAFRESSLIDFTSGRTVSIYPPILMKFGIWALDAIPLSHFEFSENRRSRRPAVLEGITDYLPYFLHFFAFFG